MNKYRLLIKNTLLLFLASFIPKTLSFFLVPLYTNCLSTADYGIADLLTNTVQLLMPFLTLQIQDAVLRFAMDKEYGEEEVYSIGLHILMMGGMILLAGLLILLRLDIFGIQIDYVVYLIAAYISSATYNLSSYFCRAIDKVSSITKASVVSVIATVSINLVLLLVCDMGLYGYLIGNTLGIMSGTVCLFVDAKLYRYVRMKAISNGLKKEMISFSIPMIFSALSWWINNASDRYILTLISGVSVAGVYAVANKIPSLLSVLGGIVAKAFSVSAIKEFDYADTDCFLGRSYNMISGAMVMGCSCLIIANQFIARILFAKEFYEAWLYVPPLLVAVLMNQMSLSCENMFIAMGKTSVISYTAAGGAIINTILNLVLIPAFGSYGAAIATMTAFSCVWSFRYYRLNKEMHLNNDFRCEFISYILIGLQMLISYYGKMYLFIQLVLLTLIISCYRKPIVFMVDSVMAGKR